jgi:hypothetical protein
MFKLSKLKLFTMKNTGKQVEIKRIILSVFFALASSLIYGIYLGPVLNHLWDQNEYYGFPIILGSILVFRYMIYPISMKVILLIFPTHGNHKYEI